MSGARRPELFLHLGAPDTPWGRIETVMLHAIFVVRRLAALKAPQMSQALVDHMFSEFDRALRQMGVSDLAVPKKMRALGGDWLGRLGAYVAPLDAKDEPALARALARNVLSREGDGSAAAALARYALACDAVVGSLDAGALERGEIAWPAIPIESGKGAGAAPGGGPGGESS